MSCQSYLALAIIVLGGSGTPIVGIQLPKFVKMGAATSAYQIEGGWNASGKGQNIWDYFTHTEPYKIIDHSTGDVAADSYHLWREDVRLLKYLGVDFYRFSLSWSRILPTGLTNKINPDGVRYYNDLIDELLKNNIQPLVTIFHWDLPKPLQNLGGMTNFRIAEYFEDYARVAFEIFGDRVKLWITFNEPNTLCYFGYSAGTIAPGLYSPGFGCYLCGKTVLLGHARAYRLYEKRFKKQQGGRIGISVNLPWAQPKTNSSEDIQATNRVLDFLFAWFIQPIFSDTGNYPKEMIKRVAKISKAQNFSESRLPPLSKIEIEYIKGTGDFVGLNYYSTNIVQNDATPPGAAAANNNSVNSFNPDIGAYLESVPDAPLTAAHGFRVVPWGIRESLIYIKEKFNNPPVIITENGFADKGQLNDDGRINFIKEHLIEVVKAIKRGCKVIGYTYWALIDNMEWDLGYTVAFGLVKVDFNSTNRTRTLKSSAKYYKELLNNRTLS